MKTSIALAVLTLTAGCATAPAARVAATPVAVEVAYEPQILVGAYPIGFSDRPLITGRILAGTQISMGPRNPAPDSIALTVLLKIPNDSGRAPLVASD